MPSDLPTDAVELLTDFLDHQRAVRGLAPETLRNRRLYLRTFAAWWAGAHGDRPLLDATLDELSAFLVEEADRGIAPATRNGQAVALRRLFAWAVHTGRVTADPTVHLQGPRVPAAEVVIYRPPDIAAILAHTAALRGVRGRVRHAVLATLRYTGVRSGELRRLRVDGLDLDAGEARVVGKGDRWRIAVVPEPLKAILAGYLAEVRPALPDSPLLFVSGSPLAQHPDRQLGPEAVYLQVELAGRHAEVAGPHFPHRWRHTYATELVRAGVDVHVVQRLMGHRSIAATVHYTHLAVDDLKSAVDHLS